MSAGVEADLCGRREILERHGSVRCQRAGQRQDDVLESPPKWPGCELHTRCGDDLHQKSIGAAITLSGGFARVTAIGYVFGVTPEPFRRHLATLTRLGQW